MDSKMAKYMSKEELENMKKIESVDADTFYFLLAGQAKIGGLLSVLEQLSKLMDGLILNTKKDLTFKKNEVELSKMLKEGLLDMQKVKDDSDFCINALRNR